jgi:tetratricopeptide (TPR) repeat protein
LILKTGAWGIENIQEIALRVHQQRDLAATSSAIKKIRADAVAAWDDFDDHGNLERLEQAIVYFQSIIYVISEDDPRLPAILSNLGSCLFRRFERLGNVADINDSIAQKEKAVNLIPEGDSSRSGYLSNLGNSLEVRFDRFGNLADLDKAIISKQVAVDLTPEGHPNKPGRLNNLASSLEARFKRLGGLVDIDDAIISNQAAVDLTPNGHPDKSVYLNNRGIILQTRFQHLGNLSDLNNAIASKQAAVDLIPDSHPSKPGRLSNLGNSLLDRFQRLGDLASLEDAVTATQAAINLTPDGHPSKPSYLSNLGNSLLARFQKFGSLVDINNAVISKQAAVNLTPQGHPDLPNRLNHLGYFLQVRFERLGNLADIEDAITFNQASVSLTPEDHPNKLLHLNGLGNALWNRSIHLQSSRDADAAITHLSAAAKTRVGLPIERFRAAKLWSSISSRTNHPSLLAAYECAISIMPLVAWSGIPITDRHHFLIEMGGITRDAAAAAISLKKYDMALEWLEQGRSIVWNQILQLRTPVDDLRAVRPELADRLVCISQILDQGSEQAGLSDGGIQSMEERGRHYRTLAMERESIIDQVRSLPNFQNFLKPPNASQLTKAARNGPVVVLNIAAERCDALGLLPGSTEVIHIPLPDITSTKIIGLRNQLKDMLHSSGVRMRAGRAAMKFSDTNDEDCRWILAELWNGVAKPVLDSLKFSVSLISSSMYPNNLWITSFFSLIQIVFHGFGGAPLDHSPFFPYTPPAYTTQTQTTSKLAAMSYHHMFLLFPHYLNHTIRR